MVFETLFHAWERRLASVNKDRVVRPFDWGLDWIPPNGRRTGAAADVVGDWIAQAMTDTDAFFTPEPTRDYTLRGDLLGFPSAFASPHPENNTVYCRYFPSRDSPSRAPAAMPAGASAKREAHARHQRAGQP